MNSNQRCNIKSSLLMICSLHTFWFTAAFNSSLKLDFTRIKLKKIAVCSWNFFAYTKIALMLFKNKNVLNFQNWNGFENERTSHNLSRMVPAKLGFLNDRCICTKIWRLIRCLDIDNKKRTSLLKDDKPVYFPIPTIRWFVWY